MGEEYNGERETGVSEPSRPETDLGRGEREEKGRSEDDEEVESTSKEVLQRTLKVYSPPVTTPTGPTG